MRKPVEMRQQERFRCYIKLCFYTYSIKYLHTSSDIWRAKQGFHNERYVACFDSS